MLICYSALQFTCTDPVGGTAFSVTKEGWGTRSSDLDDEEKWINLSLDYAISWLSTPSIFAMLVGQVSPVCAKLEHRH